MKPQTQQAHTVLATILCQTLKRVLKRGALSLLNFFFVFPATFSIPY